MKYSFLLFVTLISQSILAQSTSTISVTELSDSISETSGLLYISNTIITHNDSGDGPYLYEIDTITGNVTRAVYVDNATSYDWEDICADDDYIYVGDFGNNLGTRMNLAVLKINRNDYFNTTNDTVTCEIINFNFESQTTFLSSQFTTNYDVEAICSVGDSLFIFTKNWGNSKTNYYSLSKIPGSYAIVNGGEINTSGYVTGVVYNEINNDFLLCGYTLFESFVVRVSDFTANDFENGTIQRMSLNASTASIQVEGVAYVDGQGYYLSSELHNTGNSELVRLPYSYVVGVEKINEIKITVYPNPTSNIVKVLGVDVKFLELMGLTSKVLQTSYSTEMSLTTIPSGLYFLKIHMKNSDTYIIKKITVK